jgi:hypothetical protein
MRIGLTGAILARRRSPLSAGGRAFFTQADLEPFGRQLSVTVSNLKRHL